MTIRDRIPVEVEPLDDERLARIERAVITALPARPARTAPWRAIVPVVVAAAAVLARVWWRTAPKPAAEPAPPSAMAFAADADGTRVDLGDAIIVAGPGARFEVTRPDGGIDVALEIGKIELDVAKRGGRPPLVVHAADVEVVVVGTKFSVDRGDDVEVVVTEGAVWVRRGDEAVTVAAGEAWPVETKVVATEPIDPRDIFDAPDHLVYVPDGTTPDRPDTATGPSKRATKPKPKTVEPIELDPEDELRAAIRAQAIPKASGDSKSAQLYADGVQKHADGAKDTLRTLDRYVLTFPKGPELADVRWLRLRILCLRKLDDACRSAAHTYLSGKGDADKTRVAQRIVNYH